MSDPNPYRAPSSDLEPEAGGGDRYELTNPVGMPSGRGWAWVVGGFAYFARDAGWWVLTMLVGFVILIALALVPLIGQLASILLTFVWVGGLMLGCRAQAEGQRFELGYLFAGFQSPYVGKLMLLSVVNSVVGFMLLFAVFGSTYFELLTAGPMTDPNTVAEIADPAGLMLRLLFVMLLAIPVMMAFWFAPVLIVMHDLPVMEALRLSFIGCLRNIVPFLVYGLVGFGLFILSMLTAGVLFLIVAPAIFASVFLSYKDIFLRRVGADG